MHVSNKMHEAIHYCELFMCSQGFIILAHLAQLFPLQIYGGKVLFYLKGFVVVVFLLFLSLRAWGHLGIHALLSNSNDVISKLSVKQDQSLFSLLHQ